MQQFGRVAANDNAGGEVEQNPHGLPVLFTFETGGAHVIAVRYSFAATKDLTKGFGAWMTRGRFAPGFSGNI